MDKHTLELAAIVSRLERIEKENRRLQCLAAVSCALLFLFLVEHLGQRVGAAAVGSGQVLEAQELRIKDPSGRLRAQVRATEGPAALALYAAILITVKLAWLQQMPRLSH